MATETVTEQTESAVKPAAKKPVPRKAATRKPAARKTAGSKPAVKKKSTRKSPTGKPRAKKPVEKKGIEAVLSSVKLKGEQLKESATAAQDKIKSSADKVQARIKDTTGKAQEIVKTVTYAQLGVYGKVYDEFTSRLETTRKATPRQWTSLVARGEKLHKELEKTSGDLKGRIKSIDLKESVAKVKVSYQESFEKVKDLGKKAA